MGAQKDDMDKAACFSRNAGAITPAQQRKLAHAHIAVFGLGGVGGITAELLVRAGAGGIMVADFDKFEHSNFNRQIHATQKTIGKSKASVFAAHAKAINQKIEIKKINKKLEYASFEFFSRAISAFAPLIVIDTMDNAGSRVLLWRMCKQAGIPYVYAAASGERGMVAIVDGKNDLEKILRLPSRGREDEDVESSLVHYPQCRSAWGPATNLAGVLAANAGLNFLLGKQYPRAPKCWMIDAFAQKIVREEKLD